MMANLVVLLLFLISVVTVTNTSNVNNDISILPGILYGEAGYNAKIGQPTLNALKAKILSYTYYNNNTVYIQGNYYYVPDQVNVENYPAEMEEAKTQIYVTEYSLQQSLSYSLFYSYNNCFLPGMFSDSETEYFFHESEELYESYTASTFLIYTVYKMTNEKLNFTQEFIEALNSLPNYFNKTSCSTFNNFFDVFGTHLVLGALEGGLASARSSFSKTMLQNYTEEYIIQQLNQQFLLSTSSTTLNSTQQEQLTQLNYEFDTTYELIGGYPYLFNMSQTGPWKETIINQPVFVNMNLMDYSNLISVNDTDKRSSLSYAMINYFYDFYFGFNEINTSPPDLFYYWPKNNVLINDVAYFLAGDNNYEYSLVNNYWSTFERGPLHNMAYYACTSVGADIYCFGGYGINYYEKPYASIYNTDTSSWINFYPKIYIGEINWPNKYYEYVNCDPKYNDGLCETFIGGLAVYVNDYIYIFGGASQYNDANYYYPSGTWIYDLKESSYYWIDFGINDNTIGVMYQTSLTIDNKVYLFSPILCEPYEGNNGGGLACCRCQKGNYSTIFHLYITHEDQKCQFGCMQDPIVLASIPETLINFSVIHKNNYIFLLGGFNPYQNIYNNNIYAYDIQLNKWTTLTDKSYKTASDSIVIVVDKFMFYFGSSGSENFVQVTSLVEPC